MTTIYYVYILVSNNGVLYVGVTNNLKRRVYEHKHKFIEGFSKKYNCNKLIYFEEYLHIKDAIGREKQIKNWNRSKKIQLIAYSNPDFVELELW